VILEVKGGKGDILWFIILAARYGKVGGRVCVRGRLGSVWWKNLTAISEGVALRKGIGSSII